MERRVTSRRESARPACPWERGPEQHRVGRNDTVLKVKLKVAPCEPSVPEWLSGQSWGMPLCGHVTPLFHGFVLVMCFDNHFPKNAYQLVGHGYNHTKQSLVMVFFILLYLKRKCFICTTEWEQFIDFCGVSLFSSKSLYSSEHRTHFRVIISQVCLL